MLFYKAKAGTRDAIGEMRGVIDTKEKWEKARGAYSEEVKAWMAQNGSLTCRGCHDLARMGGGKAQPAIVEMHAGLAKAGPGQLSRLPHGRRSRVRRAEEGGVERRRRDRRAARAAVILNS